MTDTIDPRRAMTRKLWLNSLLIMFGVNGFFYLYVILLDGPFTPTSFAKVMAGTANFLFAASLSLSSLGYFFDFLDSKVVYRKYFGLLGYFSALAYTLLLPVLRPDYYWYGFAEHLWSSDFLLGLSAMAIFTMMAIISNDRMMLAIGPVRWRNLLRLGYVAFFLLVIRAVLNESNPIGADPRPEYWGYYLQTFDTLPPPRLLFSIIGTAVVSIRLAVEYDKWRKRRSAAASTNVASTSGV
ncbi:MAG: hypothetical protein ACEQSB_03055 [Undibacterium sp.]